MFAANAEDNRIALGGIYSGQQYIQLQLVATCNPAALLDDDSGQDDDEEGPAMAPTHGPLVTHWLAARAEFIAAGGEGRGIETSPGSCWHSGPCDPSIGWRWVRVKPPWPGRLASGGASAPRCTDKVR